MIPKVIHYCWFGKNKKSKVINECIESWKTYCPDYEIVEWNENNFDINCIPYVKEAYLDKKWAFVSDYARLFIIYNYGGIYLDTDVLLHRDLNELLKYDCWLASDDVRYINTGLGFGAVSKHPLIGEVMRAYEGYEYPSGTNVIRDTRVFEKELADWKKSDKSQVLNSNILVIGMNDYGRYARHLYTYTWAEQDKVIEREKLLREKKELTWKEKVSWKIKCTLRNPTFIHYFDRHRGTRREKIYVFIAYDFLDNGLLHYIRRIFGKIFRYN